MFRKVSILIVICLLHILSYPARAAAGDDGTILDKNTPIYTSASVGTPLFLAVEALQRDLKKVLGGSHPILPLTAIKTTGIVVLNSQKDGLQKKLTGWEAHQVYRSKIAGQAVVIAQGADTRGTIYAVYTVSEKLLGVPPLWYFSSWQPQKKKRIVVPPAFHLLFTPPTVKYRAWFPNDMDLFQPWRKQSADNYALWLETALRLKLNTIEWIDDEQDYSKPFSVSPTTQLISDYGLINTSHHHSPLNASFSGWKDYWQKYRDTTAPALLLSNEKYLEEFWRYNVECVRRNHIDMLWVLGFRGNGDHPFWYTFKDAPRSMQERGAVITRMLERQRQIVLSVTHDPHTKFRTIFYDELSDLLAKGYIRPPADSSFIWTYVAARRDHYPNNDIREVSKQQNLLLGYYFNYQFTSTGSHLAAGEGPWKMEKNFRFVASKSNRPIAYSVVNAGNIREFLTELSANAAMMWDFKQYSSDRFLLTFCQQYFGAKAAHQAALLYKAYYDAFWHQRKPDLKGFNRQYIFQDLRYKKAIEQIAGNFKDRSNLNPLTDIAAEQVPGRTYRIVPEDNNADNQIDAIIHGTAVSSEKFLKTATAADALYKIVDPEGQAFFSDNLRQPAFYMYYLNDCLLQLSKAYKQEDHEQRGRLVAAAINSLKAAENALRKNEHGVFSDWYSNDRVFGFDHLYKVLAKITQS